MLAVCVLVLTACASSPPKKVASATLKVERPASGRPSTAPAPFVHNEWEPVTKGGGYYLDDGPGDLRPVGLEKMPNAEPQYEPLVPATLRQYTVMGQTFIPQSTLEEPYKQRGRASWYGRKFHGAKTSSGEIYDMFQMTAAHPTLPLPSYAKVTNLSNGKSVIVRVNDRGPFLHSRIMDLSYAAAFKLGYAHLGSAEVVVEKLTPELIALYKLDPVGFVDAQPVLADADTKPLAVNRALVAYSNATGAFKPQVLGPVYLQVGAFGALNNAENMRNQVQSVDLRFADSTRVHQAEGLYRVYVGPFESREQAHEAAFQLASRTEIKPVVKEGLILP